MRFDLSRRGLLSLLALPGAAGMARLVGVAQAQDPAPAASPSLPAGHHGGAGNAADFGNHVVGSVDYARNGFDPHKLLTDWDVGQVSEENGRRVREWTITAGDIEFEVAPGVFFPGWAYNGRVPGPTLRCTEGEQLRVHFSNGSTHPHTIHFHGIHAARMDGIPGAGLVQPGETFTYEFDAKPFGCHLYHCHSLPLKRHIHKGLYGAFIVDPDPERHPLEREAAQSRLLGSPANQRWQEIVLVMNGFDTNFDDENEFYAVNSIPFAYAEKGIRVERSRPLRVYLVNITEFDPLNSLHLHANFFDYFDHGTTLTPTLRTVDTIMQCQGQRGILEISFAEHEPGLYMFHAHQSEFAELGWMSHFEVV
jgi:FtsP/CotA-like multicopper oxidase with cupredoxin domain